MGPFRGDEVTRFMVSGLLMGRLENGTVIITPFLLAPGFEPRASHLLGRRCPGEATPPVLSTLVIFQVELGGFCPG